MACVWDESATSMEVRSTEGTKPTVQSPSRLIDAAADGNRRLKLSHCRCNPPTLRLPCVEISARTYSMKTATAAAHSRCDAACRLPSQNRTPVFVWSTNEIEVSHNPMVSTTQTLELDRTRGTAERTSDTNAAARSAEDIPFLSGVINVCARDT
eukprot:3397780-Prymnesium_polylepis.2